MSAGRIGIESQAGPFFGACYVPSCDSTSPSAQRSPGHEAPRLASGWPSKGWVFIWSAGFHRALIGLRGSLPSRAGRQRKQESDEVRRDSPRKNSLRRNRWPQRPRSVFAVPPQDPEQARWFAQHLLAHEPRLRIWLQSRFSETTDVDDVIQDSYVRVLAARETRELQSPKAFFFATARNLMIERWRKRQIANVTYLGDLSDLPALEDGDDVSETVARRQEVELMIQAIQSLPKRCRQVMMLRNVYGLSQREIATELGISLRTVETQVAIGVKRCTRFGERFR